MRAMLTELHQRWQGTADREWCLGPLAAGRITVDADQLMLALDALVENAVQHTGPGDKISLSSSAVGDRLEIRVRDGGSGIPPAAVQRSSTGSTASTGHATGGWVGRGLASPSSARWHMPTAAPSAPTRRRPAVPSSS